MFEHFLVIMLATALAVSANRKIGWHYHYRVGRAKLPTPRVPKVNGEEKELISALMGLGSSRADAVKTVNEVCSLHSGKTFDELLMECLR